MAGLVNAYPAASVKLFELASAGEESFALYKWFLPLLRMDTVPKFVQLIKWVQEQAGVGSARVRAPRMEISGAELEVARAVFAKAKAEMPGGDGAGAGGVLRVVAAGVVRWNPHLGCEMWAPWCKRQMHILRLAAE